MATPATLAPPVVSTPPADPPAEPAEPLVWESAPEPTPKPSAKAPEPVSTPEPTPPATPPAPVADAKLVETPTPEWKAKLDAKDPDFLKEVLSHPVLAGHIGGLAQKQAQADVAAAQKAAQEAALDDHARNNPDDPLAQARLAERNAELQKQWDQVAEAKGFQTAHGAIADYVKAMPEDVRVKLAELAPEGKLYGDGTDFKAFALGYMGDVVKAATATEVAKAKATWEKEELPAKWKDYLAAKGESEPSPDLGTGSLGSGAGGGLTDEKYAQMSPQELRALKSTPAGRAQIDKLWATTTSA